MEKDTIKDIRLAILEHEKADREEADNRYALKQVEKLAYGIVWVILGAVVLAVIKTVLIK
jgi:hypothetical protein